MDITSAIIGALVGIISGGAVATLGAIVPLRNELTNFRLSLSERVARLEEKEENMADRIESLKADMTRRLNHVLRAIGRRELPDHNEDFS